MFRNLGKLFYSNCFVLQWSLMPKGGEVTCPRSYRAHVKFFPVLIRYSWSNFTDLLAFTSFSTTGITTPAYKAMSDHITTTRKEKGGEDAKLYLYGFSYESLCDWMINAYLAHIHVVKKSTERKYIMLIGIVGVMQTLSVFTFLNVQPFSGFPQLVGLICSLTFIKHLSRAKYCTGARGERWIKPKPCLQEEINQVVGKELCKNYTVLRTSLAVQWLRVHLPMQGIQVQSLVREKKPTCLAL